MKRILSMLIVMLVCQLTWAYDFSVTNSDGKTIYYKKDYPTTVRVTYDEEYIYNTYSGAIVIPSEVTYNGTTYSVTTIGVRAFYGCPGLTEVTIPNSVTSINSKAFCGCTGLTSVTIPNSVTSIGGDAFGGCTGLTSMNIPNSVIYIGDYAFGGCTGLTSMNIPNSVIYIGDYAFDGCTGLTSVTIPNSVTLIGAGTFCDCSGLTSVSIPNSVTSIGKYAFKSCRCLTSLTIPNSVTEIGNYAFYDCTGLTSLTIPNSVTEIGNHAFYICTGLMQKPTQVSSTELSVTCKVSSCNIDPVDKYFVGDSGSTSIGSDATVYASRPEYSTSYSYGFMWKGNKYYIGDVALTTGTPSVSINKSATASSISGILRTSTTLDNELYWCQSETKSVRLTGLDPNTEYSSQYKYALSTGDYSWGKLYTESFTTQPLAMATLPGVALNTTTALLCAETNVDDDEVNVGFEWRRYDAPETLPSSKVTCAVDDGKLQGALINLNPTVYYNYRPYYTSNSGHTYYGEWITFFTGDASVYFDPTVKTYSAEMVGDYSALLRGYALRGSSEIASQGFEYWTAWGGMSRAGEDVTEVIVGGQKLNYNLQDLTPGTTYEYRAFAETANGRVYGDTKSFTTTGAMTEIEPIIDNADSEVYVVGYYNLQGYRSENPMRGYNIVVYSDGSTRKLLIK